MNELYWDLGAVCICGHQGRKHHSREHAHAFTCTLCACLYFETAPIDPSRPIEAQLADAIRCTSHIEERELRAKYVLKDMQLRGYVFQQVKRDPQGRFIERAVA